MKVDYSGYKDLQIERRGRVLTVTMNRPATLNSVTPDMHEELSRLFYDIGMDDETYVCVLTGAGRAFSAGGDIEGMQFLRDNPTVFERSIAEAKKIVFGLLDCEKPMICRMNGDAVGLGATLALFCDIIIASDSARIGDPHVRVGLAAGDGGAIIWPQLIGYARAKQYLFSGDLIGAKEAAQIGLINFAVPADELDEKVNAWADKLANGAWKSIKFTKMTTNIGLRQLAHSMMDACIAYETITNLSDDHGEAIVAVREKRKPKFTGS